MNRILLLVGLLVSSFCSFSQISTFPYREDFEGGPAGWTPSGALWQHGIPPTPAMSDADEQCINNVFATNLTGAYNNNANESVTSPQFDFSGLTTDPVISFDMFRQNEDCCDEVWVEYTINGGANWNKVVGPGINWYNDGFNQWWDNNTTGYQTCSATLTGAAGAANAQVRFVFTSDGSVTYEGMAFDNVTIGEPTFYDLEILEVISPTSGPNLGSVIPVTVVITNNGPATASFMNYAICLNGDVPPTCETTITDIAGYATETITLLTTLDLSTLDNIYNINFFISHASPDLSTCNDTMNLNIKNYEPISNFPYTEDFENGNGDWASEETIWQHGVPTTSLFQGANTACHNNVVVTNLTGNYPNDAFEVIESPFFNFSSFTTDPIIKFDMFRHIEECCDEVWFEYTTNNGATWQKLIGPGVNWYNDLGNQWWDSNTTGWTNTEATLTGLAGEAEVRFRFVFTSDGSVVREGIGIDNVYIGDANYVDLELVEVLSPLSTTICETLPTSQTVEVVVRNNGNTAIAAGDYSICFDGDVPMICETMTTSIPAGVTDTLMLVSTLNFSTPGTYNLNYYVATATTPVKACDDTLSFTYTIGELPVSNIPDSTACAPVDLTTFNADAILWSTSETTQTITASTSGQYIVQLTNTGCPTVSDTVNIVINAPTTGTDVQTACGSFQWIDGITYTSDNNTATFVIPNAAGCDSTITLDLTITQPSSATDVQVACDSYTWIDGITYTSSNNTAMFTLQNSVGCDSVVTLDLTINSANTATTTTDFTITADATGATYQWINCATNMPISGETNQSYTATANGNYAVVVTENGCTDTSACVAITNIGLSENSLAQFALYPNPTSGKVAIDFSDVQESIQVRVITLSGQLVSTFNEVNSASIELNIEGAPGVYLVEVMDQHKQVATVRVIKD